MSTANPTSMWSLGITVSDLVRHGVATEMDDYDETPSQLQRRLPLDTRVRHLGGWEGTVIGWEYGQVVIQIDRSGQIRFCYGRNVTRVVEDD
jgi:hypothetical protein